MMATRAGPFAFTFHAKRLKVSKEVTEKANA